MSQNYRLRVRVTPRQMVIDAMKATAWYIGTTFVLLVIFVPLLWVIASSLRDNQEIFRYINPFSFRAFFPEAPSFEAYREIFQKGYGRAVYNTAVVTAILIVGGVYLNGLAGFVFAKMDFKFRQTVFLVVLFTSLVPFEAIAVPLYTVATALQLRNTLSVLILPGIGNGLVVFLFKQFFEDIPNDLIEVTQIDGGSWWLVFHRVFMPISKPAIISGSLLLFLFSWNAFLWPLIAAPAARFRLIQVAIANLQMEFQTLWNEIFAAGIIAAAVPIVLILVFQRYFVRGISTTGMK